MRSVCGLLLLSTYDHRAGDAHSTLAVIVVLRAHFKQTKQGESSASLLPSRSIRKHGQAHAVARAHTAAPGWHLHVIRGKQYARAQLGDPTPPPPLPLPRFLRFLDAQVALCNHLLCIKCKACVRRF